MKQNPGQGRGGHPYKASDGATLNPGNAGKNVRGKARSFVQAVRGNYSALIPSFEEYYQLDQPDFMAKSSLEEMASGLIGNWPELNILDDFRIRYLWKAKGGATGGRPTLGKTVLTSGLLQFFGECDWVIWLAADHCRAMEFSDEHVEALLYHELLHCQVDEEADGKLGLQGHDFEGFYREIERYGFWTQDLATTRDSIQARLAFDGGQP